MSAVPIESRRRRSVPVSGRVVSGRVVRGGRWSALVDTRAVGVSTALAFTLAAVGCWSVSVGDFPVPIVDVARAIAGDAPPDAEFVVMTLRLPRVCAAMAVGGAFAVAGGIFQALARNPLASPDVVGFNSGAALGAVFTIVMIDGASSSEVSVGAIAGGLAAAVAVYLLAYRNGVHGYRLILVGIGIGFALTAGVDYLLTRAELYDAQRAAMWLTGSLNGRTWDDVRPLAAGLAVLLPTALVLSRSLRLIELGADTAASLGVRVGWVRSGLILVAVGLAALATAAAGPVGFVALVSAPVARRLVRSPGVCIVPTALTGALLTTVADLAARRVMAPTELPVGIATAVIGAPYLLWLLAREIRIGVM